MGLQRYIWIKNKRYYLYEKCETFADALEIAKNKREENPRCKYFILTIETGQLFGTPKKVYVLYLTHYMRFI